MAHKKSLFNMMLSKSAALLASIVLVVGFTVVSVTPVYAYDNYADCIASMPADVARQSGRSVQSLDDNDRTFIQEECRNRFPSSTPPPTATATTTASAIPRATNSATPSSSVTATTTPSATATVTPTTTAQPTSTSTLQPSVTSQPRATSQSSTSSSGGGADNRPIYDRIIPPNSTDVLTPTFATQNNPSIGGLVNYLFDFAVRRLLPILVGVLVLVITWGGFQYIMAQGDSGKAKIAKDTILFGIIGLVVALAALSIVTILNNVILQS